ncbi:hypothetical protein K0M31_006338 [Melipona bicolor]|uniref:Uncharacterized protein n=1 Tax=Melipona bicolor TaxID=60889 RepID=A0AA40FU25_9HYME|nr:hypothetical protein K0M31_006338 [Melipona bicolor]
MVVDYLDLADRSLQEGKLLEKIRRVQRLKRKTARCDATVAAEAAAASASAGGSCVRRANNLVSNHLTHVTRWL